MMDVFQELSLLLCYKTYYVLIQLCKIEKLQIKNDDNLFSIAFYIHCIIQRDIYHRPYHRYLKRHKMKKINLARKFQAIEILFKSWANYLKKLYEQYLQQTILQEIHLDEISLTHTVYRSLGKFSLLSLVELVEFCECISLEILIIPYLAIKSLTSCTCQKYFWKVKYFWNTKYLFFSIF